MSFDTPLILFWTRCFNKPTDIAATPQHPAPVEGTNDRRRLDPQIVGEHAKSPQVGAGMRPMAGLSSSAATAIWRRRKAGNGFSLNRP